MPLYFKRGNIADVRSDALVVPTSHSMSVRRDRESVDSLVFSLADEQIEKELITSGGCETGKAKIFPSHGLPCKHLIYTVGPRWRGGDYGEENFLRSCYKECFALAKSAECESVSFPLIASGGYGVPKEIAVEVAVSTLKELVANEDITVYLVLYDDESERIGNKYAAQLKELVGEPFRRKPDVWACIELPFPDRDESDLRSPLPERRRSVERKPNVSYSSSYLRRPTSEFLTTRRESERASFIGNSLFDLSDEVKDLDESFTDMLIRKISERDIKNSDCYKRANVDKKLFSKIISNVHYKPKKTTAVAFAVALELSLEETEELLRKAGFALSKSQVFDKIVTFFIKQGNYNIFEINEALFMYDQSLLGSV